MDIVMQTVLMMRLEVYLAGMRLKVNSTVRTSCFYGPPEVDVVRFCSSNNTLTTPVLEMCRTIISSRFTDLENVR